MSYRKFAAVSAALFLTACASSGGESHYRGVYAPGGVRIGADGAFASRAAVWNGSDLPIAADAARDRLVRAALQEGYAYYVVESVKNFVFFGQQVLLNGRLFRAGDAPAGAAPIAALSKPADANVVEWPQQEVRKPRPRKRPYEAAKPVERPVAIPAAVVEEEKPVKAVANEPVVIEAPDFVDEEPKQPVN